MIHVPDIAKISGGVAGAATLWRLVVQPLMQLIVKQWREWSVLYERIEKISVELAPVNGQTLRDQMSRIESASQRAEERQRVLLAMCPFGVFESDEHGDYVYVNRTIVRWLGRPPYELMGGGFATAIAQRDRARVMADWKDACKEYRQFEDRHSLIGADGEEFEVHVRAFPMTHLPLVAPDEDTNKVIGYLGVMTREENGAGSSALMVQHERAEPATR